MSKALLDQMAEKFGGYRGSTAGGQPEHRDARVKFSSTGSAADLRRRMANGRTLAEAARECGITLENAESTLKMDALQSQDANVVGISKPTQRSAPAEEVKMGRPYTIDPERVLKTLAELNWEVQTASAVLGLSERYLYELKREHGPKALKLNGKTGRFQDDPDDVKHLRG